MFGFWKKDEKEQLQKKYKRLMDESYRLSTSNRRESDLKRAEAEEIAKQLDSYNTNQRG